MPELVSSLIPPHPLSCQMNYCGSWTLSNRTRGKRLRSPVVRVQDRPSARTAAQRLLARGVGAVAVQAGADGNLLVWRDGECWLPHLPVASVDATGAGDAFAANLAVGLAEGRSWAEVGPTANAAAALTTTVLGAQAGLPKRGAVLALLAHASVTDCQ